MRQFMAWPPPDWTQCIVTWDEIMSSHQFRPQALYDWCDRYPSESCYHVHGWENTEGFAFRFEDPKDAVVFKLTWPAL